mmetsp:Transcript_16165/g.29158  ORF Transcript_16165/g.29158 Transcript_16165/m.29158 type:complete len:514 (+) Transcript_16165:47-1588(+)
MIFYNTNPISPPQKWLWTPLLVQCFALSSVVAFYSPLSTTHINANNHVFGSALRSSATSTEIDDTKDDKNLDDKQLEFCKAYLNEHHATDVLLPFTRAFSELGSISVKKNAWMGGSYSILGAEVTDITSDALHLEATVQEGQTTKTQNVVISLDSDPVKSMARTYPTLPPIDPLKLERASKVPIDNFCRRMIRLCNIVKAYEATGKMIQMGVQLGGKGVGKLHDDMYLNQVPHNRYVRQYFYEMAAEAALEATIICSNKQFTNRMKITALFPEMNPSMDSYRIGTLLELSRAMAMRLAEQNLRVRVCVQGSMGVGIFTGVPKQLNGVSTLLQRMDWESEPGEPNEGMVGDYINFGFVGKDHVVDFKKGEGDIPDTQQDDVFIIICPQNMVGLESSIYGPLSEMVDAAGDRPVILLNPDLTDKVSAQGQQSVRGRQQRLDFSDSFETIYQFQNIYFSGTSYFPILGSVVKLGPLEPWVAHQRRDLVDNGGEVYLPIYSSETVPESEVIMTTLSK